MFVSHLKRRLHRGLLLPSSVTTQLQRVVGVETPWSQVTGSTHAPEDGPDVGHTLLVSECDRHPYRVVYGVCLRLRWVGWQAYPPASLIGSSQGTTQELNPWGSPVNLGLPSSQIILADSLLEVLNVGKVEDKSTLGSLGTISRMPQRPRVPRIRSETKISPTFSSSTAIASVMGG